MDETEYTLYSEVKSQPVEWLWYPYIPYGKITLLQGDPGDGKSTMIVNLISTLSTSGYMPSGNKLPFPVKTIYQCSEDGIEDTIKPRLERYGADCRKVAFISEQESPLKISDDRLRQAVESFGARLVVIDPIQAYIGDDASMFNVGSIRQVMKSINNWANKRKCAVILVGHMTKKEHAKDLYRSMGSIDFIASARSVLYVSKHKSLKNIRCVQHVKSSLAPLGKTIGFEIGSSHGFKWVGQINDDGEIRELYEKKKKKISKRDDVAKNLIQLLRKGPIKASEVASFFSEKGIGMRTVNEVKSLLGIESYRANNQWYWK
ncbi:AAA family ATPase [Anaerovibrio lipolyticus]|uniref:AAA family ATPase n=1 Tax=Anaerovibrio lipolyticus TaxID=82374 RepID=UPI0026EF2DE2|nr:AAA family ATPase [Anaerovibrio lipolyticus]MBE6105341.1 AAA family ATPase [Anaerovibrio lipolyticus]